MLSGREAGSGQLVAGRWAGRGSAHSWLTFCLTFLQIQSSGKVFNVVLQLTHIVSSGSLLSCDAMFFSFGSQFSVKKCIFWR